MRDLFDVKVGQRFMIPYPGGYARCCRGDGSVATFQMVRCKADMGGKGQKCVECGEVVPNDSTLVQYVELVS